MAEARPVLDDLDAWLAAQPPKLSGKTLLAGAIRRHGSPTRSPALPITKSPVSTNSCLGVTLSTERNC
jgi:hypothetical protein